MPARLPILAIVVALALAACRPGGTTTTTTIAEAPTTTDSSVGAPTPSTSTSTTTTTEPPDPITAQINELMSVTEDIRALDFVERPTITILSKDELKARVRETYEEELDPAEFEIDDALYTLLGLIGPDVDLLQLFVDLFAEQTAAFYDLETDELVAPATEGEFTVLQRITMVHELTHALTDQHFDLFPTLDRYNEEDRFDEALAMRALVEGDATLVEIFYLVDLPTEDQLAALAEAGTVDTSIFDSAPKFLQDSLLFPYIAGQQYVGELYGSQGFAAVDEAYRNLPVTTEQIYDPSAFLDKEAGVSVDSPPVALDGYEIVEASVWGYASFKWMLEGVLGSGDASRAADGWGGDTYQVHWDGQDVVFVLDYRGDDDSDAIELYEALVDYAREAMNVGSGTRDGSGTAFEAGDYAFVTQIDDRVVFIAATDPAAGRAARAFFPEL